MMQKGWPMESTSTAIAAESIRTLLARFRAASEKLAPGEPALSPDAVETSQHHLEHSAVVTVKRLSPPDAGGHWLDILTALESVLNDASFRPELGILFDYRQTDLRGAMFAAALRSLVGAVSSPKGLNSRCAMVLDAKVDLAEFPLSLFASVAYGESHNFRVFVNEDEAAGWVARDESSDTAQTK